ncbi:hypothetical protein ACQY0O_001290 [Thecaphora frezii]
MPSTHSFIGVAVAVAGNVTISLALNCQKLAHLRLQHEAASAPDQQRLSHPTIKGKDLEDDGDHNEDEGYNDPRGNETEHDAFTHRPATPSPPQRRKRWRNESASSSTASGNDAVRAQRENGDRLQDHSQATKQDEEDESDSASEDGRAGDGGGGSTEFLKSKLWWLGIALMTIGECGNFISYGFAPASLVAPLGAVALLSNVIISPILLKERFKAADIGGILLAIIGAVTVVFSSKPNDDRLGPDGLLHAIKRTEFVVYAAISVGFGTFLTFLSRTKLADKWVLVDVGACAIFGGFTVLSTKGISSLISGGQPIEALKYPITYALAFVLAVTAVIQITYLNKALQRFDSREVIPTQFVFFTISAIVGSAILYRDFENTDANRLINFLFGCLTTFAGVFVLTRKKDGSNNEHRQATVDDNGGDGHDERDLLLSRSWHGGDQRDVRSTSRGHAAVGPAGSSPSSNNRKLIKVHTPMTLSPLPRRPGPTPAPSAAMTTGSVPFSVLAPSSRRQRSRTSSPNRLPTAGFQGAQDLSQSAATSAGILSASVGLRTPRLSLIGLDRPTGLSPGHYLLFATSPPPLSVHSQHTNPRPSSSYGSTYDTAGLLLPVHMGDAESAIPVGAKQPTSYASPGRYTQRHRRQKSRASNLSTGGESLADVEQQTSHRGASAKKRRTSNA